MTLRPYCQSDSAIAEMRAHGCGLFALLSITAFATEDDISPDTRGSIDFRAKLLKRLSGVSDAEFNARGTTLDEVERAYEGQVYRRFDRVPPKMRKYHGGLILSQLFPALKDGKAGLVAVNYGKVQDAGLGKGMYRGGHWVAVADPQSDGAVMVADPLRRSLIRWPFHVLLSAAETFGRRPWLNGRGEFGVVDVAPTWQSRINELRAELAKCRDGDDDCAGDVAAERQRWTDWLAGAPK